MAMDEQEEVARVLRARPRVPVPPGFAERVAARIGAEPAGGFLDVINWRAWTFGLAPAAAALLVAAWIGIGVETSREPATPDEWNADVTASAAFLQPTTTGDALLEVVLTGAAGEPREEPRDVR